MTLAFKMKYKKMSITVKKKKQEKKEKEKTEIKGKFLLGIYAKHSDFCNFDSHPIAPRIDDGPISYSLQWLFFFLRIWIIICWRYMNAGKKRGRPIQFEEIRRRKPTEKLKKNRKKIGTATQQQRSFSLSPLASVPL